MKKHKIGHTIPSISKNEALLMHNNENNCSKPFIVIQPLCRINHVSLFRYRWYNVDQWTCFNCNWKSEEMKKRTT